MKYQKTLLLLDGNALLHRAWHALPQSMTTKDGTVVNAVYGFARALEMILDEFDPDYMAVAWDLEGKTFRHEEYAEYKAHREDKPQELYDQIPMIQELLDAFGIPWLGVEGYEADDVIATLSTKAGKKGVNTLIVTGDLDTLQLVDDVSHVIFFQRGISQTKRYDVEAVRERYELDPEQLIDFKALRGDPSDNIPGIAGIGKVTAQKLLSRHEDIDGLLEALEAGEVEGKYAKKLEGEEGTLKQSRRLVQMVHDVPMDFEFTKAKIEEPDTDKIVSLFKDWGFKSLLKNYEREKHQDVGQKALKQFIETDIKACKRVLDRFETKSVGIYAKDKPEDLFGDALSHMVLSDGTRVLIIPSPSAKHLQAVYEFMDGVERIVVDDWKGLMHMTDWTSDGAWFDLHIAAYLLDPGNRSYDIKTLGYEHLGTSLPELPASIDTDKAKKSVAHIVSLFPALAAALDEAMDEKAVKEVFETMEMPLVSILYEMEKNGIKVDEKALKTFSKTLQKRIDELVEEIHALAGEPFNVNSPQQLSKVLFEDLDLPTKGIKKTQTGYSTAASQLDKLEGKHDIIPLVKEYRELAKLQSTYVEALLDLIEDDGRIHTTYNQTVTSTGRLSSSEPNLQNIPIRTDLGKEIRKSFVAEKGKRLIAADYSQVELRLVAVIAQDEEFIKTFKEGADVHTRTAAQVFKVEEDDVTKKQRRAAKAINFGILYGMGPRSLARSTGFSFTEAKNFIKRYFKVHSAIEHYLDKTKAKAKENGYVETLFGRRRYLPAIDSGAHRARAAAERMAINMPVQGTAADIMKLAMIDVHGWLKQSDWPAKMLLQVHDEIVLEVDSDAVKPVADGVRAMMKDVADYEVPLEVDVAVGKRWGDMKDIEA